MTITFFSSVGYGGAHNHLVTLANVLNRKGVKVKCFFILSLAKDQGLAVKSIRKNLKCEYKIFWLDDRFPKTPSIFSHYLSIIKVFFIQYKVSQIIKSYKSNFIFVNPCRFTQTPFILLFLKKLRVIYYFCEPKREFYEVTSFAHYKIRWKIIKLFLFPVKILDKLILKLSLNESLLIISCSNLSKRLLGLFYGIKGDGVIYPGISFPSSKRANKKVGNQRLKFLSVGSLNYHKGFDTLIKALSYLPSQYRHLTLIGNGGNDLQQIKTLASVLKVKVIIKQNVDEDTLYKEYQKAKYFIYSPRREPFGITPFEAMSFRVIPIVTDSGGYAEIFRKWGRNFLAPPHPKQFAKKIFEVTNSKQLLKEYQTQVQKMTCLLNCKYTSEKLFKRAQEKWQVKFPALS